MKGEGRRKEREVGKEEGRKTGKGRAPLSPCSVWHPIISSWNTITVWWEGCAHPVLSGRQVHSGWAQGYKGGACKAGRLCVEGRFRRRCKPEAGASQPSFQPYSFRDRHWTPMVFPPIPGVWPPSHRANHLGSFRVLPVPARFAVPLAPSVLVLG